MLHYKSETGNNGKTRNKPYIEMKGIIRDFGHIRALDDVNFNVYPQEIVGLVGDNGAGKSTLIKVISGVLQPTEGTIYIDGIKTRLESSKVAMAYGIETIYQDMNLIDRMNIIRNIFCGREETDGLGFMKVKDMKQKAMDVLEKEISIEGIYSPNQIVKNLSGGQRQAVALARAVYFKKKMLLLDEPTSALSVKETKKVLDYIKQMKKEGVSCVFVTHNLHHAYIVSDRFVILSHGKIVTNIEKNKTNIDNLADIIISH
jgi:simple sugar transport system ATP-binding protein